MLSPQGLLDLDLFTAETVQFSWTRLLLMMPPLVHTAFALPVHADLQPVGRSFMYQSQAVDSELVSLLACGYYS